MSYIHQFCGINPGYCFRIYLNVGLIINGLFTLPKNNVMCFTHIDRQFVDFEPYGYFVKRFVHLAFKYLKTSIFVKEVAIIGVHNSE